MATFNTYLLSPLFVKAPYFTDQVEKQIGDRAQSIGEAVCAYEPAIDVITFNEVWRKEWADRLFKPLENCGFKHRLTVTPIMPKIEGTGLAVASRLPLDKVRSVASTPDVNKLFQSSMASQGAFLGRLQFGACDSEDCLAAKSAAIVRVNATERFRRIVDVVFTHTQADDKLDSVFARRSQLLRIPSLYEAFVEDHEREQDLAVVMGDTNVPTGRRPGSVDPALPKPRGNIEWQQYFHPRFKAKYEDFRFFGRSTIDSFDETNPVADKGATNPGRNYRLDQIAVRDRVGLCIAHVRNAFGTLSDHVGVVAEMNYSHDAVPGRGCNPVSAIPLRDGGRGNKVLEVTPTDTYTQSRRGAPMWFTVRRGGSWNFGILGDGDSFRLELYHPSNMSQPMADYRREKTRVKVERYGDQTLTKYALPAPPILVKVVPRSRTRISSFRLLAYRNKCSKPEDACALRVNDAHRESTSKPINADDRFWFSFVPLRNTSADAQSLDYGLTTSSSSPAELAVIGKDINTVETIPGPGGKPQPLRVQVGPSSTGALSHKVSNDRRVLFSVDRGEPCCTGFEVRVRSDLVHLTRSYARVVDETGPDWAGADEGQMALEGHESLKSLPSFGFSGAHAGNPIPGSFAWAGTSWSGLVDVTVTEDDPGDDDHGAVTLAGAADLDALPADQPELNHAVEILVDADDEKDGLYTFQYGLAYDPLAVAKAAQPASAAILRGGSLRAQASQAPFSSPPRARAGTALGRLLVSGRGDVALDDRPLDVDEGAELRNTLGSGRLQTIADDGTDEQLLDTLPQPASSPAVSPDGQRLAYVRGGRVWVARTDGSEPRRIRRALGPDPAPSWSPDGRRLAFVAPGHGGSDLFIVSSKTLRPRRLSATAGTETSPVWSDRRRLIVSFAHRRSFDLVEVPLRGARRRLTRDRGHELEPAVSPDGRLVAFVSNRGDSRWLRVMSLRHLRSRIVAGPMEGLSSPTFSPDRSRIAFVGGDAGAPAGGGDPRGVLGVLRVPALGGLVERVSDELAGRIDVTYTNLPADR